MVIRLMVIMRVRMLKGPQWNWALDTTEDVSNSKDEDFVFVQPLVDDNKVQSRE